MSDRPKEPLPTCSCHLFTTNYTLLNKFLILWGRCDLDLSNFRFYITFFQYDIATSVSCCFHLHEIFYPSPHFQSVCLSFEVSVL